MEGGERTLHRMRWGGGAGQAAVFPCAARSLGALVMVGPVALWLALWFILRWNCRAVCPDCGHGPMGGNAGWKRESLMLWAGVAACFLGAVWGTFHLVLLAWLFIWLMFG